MAEAQCGPFVLDLFEAVAKSTPARRALQLEDGRGVSYGELDGLADQISRVVGHIIASSAGGSDAAEPFEDGKVNTPLVALMMDRDVAFIASMLGVLKAEAGYVPVDPTFPSDRQSYIFEQSRCQCLIIDAENYSAALSLGVQLPTNVIRIDTKTAKIVNPVFPEHLLPPVIPTSQRVNDPDSLAYILYTSGSTGKPKGVMVKNAGVINQIEWFAEDLKSGPHSVILGLATFCFDISVLEIYLPLTRGGLLVLAQASTQKDPFRILELIELHKVNFFQATPTTYDMMFAIGWKGDANIDFLVGGEAFRPSLLPAVRNCNSFRNVYGPTETTVWASGYVVPRDYGGVSIPPVGAPGRGYVFRVIDFQKGAPWREVEPGQEGELWIGGNSVGRGYLRRPDLTKEVYLPDTFAGHGLIYRTGDLVKLLPDGVNYQFLQRIDNQVKIDGFRIELQEIENVYISHPLVEQAVALVKSKKLAIYLKPSSKDRMLSSQQQNEIHEFAKKSLMYYMMPKATVIVENFALTATSKIDRKALPEPDWASAASSTSNLDSTATPRGRMRKLPVGTPQTPSMVSHLLQTIESTSGRRLTSGSNFATMGVDSLAAVIFVKQLSDSLGGIRIEPKKIFAQGMTVKRFAQELQEKLAAQNPDLLISMGIAQEEFEDEEAASQSGASQKGSPLKKKLSFHVYDEDLEEADNLDKVETLGSTLDAAFTSDCIASNIKMFEGLRGLFTFMVLAGHYLNYTGTPERENWNVYTTKGDVFLFLMVTGFTSSIQLRQTPRYSTTEDGKRVLLPRDQFNWPIFLITRMVGVFPILWMALAFNAPVWYKVDLYSDGFSGPDIVKKGSPMDAGCVILYVVGMQSWVRPACHYIGPNNCVYGSAVLNVFFLYTLIRLAMKNIQEYLMTFREEHFVLPLEWTSEAEAAERDAWGGHKVLSANRTWRQWVGNTATMYAYNRVNTEQAILATGFWFLFIFGVIYKLFADAAWAGLQTQNAIQYGPYFLMGAALASLTEVWHSALFQVVGGSDNRPAWRRHLSAFASYIYNFTNDRAKLGDDGWASTIAAVAAADGKCGGPSCEARAGDVEMPGAADASSPTWSVVPGQDEPTTTTPPAAEEEKATSAAASGFLRRWSLAECGFDARDFRSDRSTSSHCLVMYSLKLFWRFLPDMLFIGSTLVVMGYGWLKTKYLQPRPPSGMGDGADMVIWWIGLPIITAMYIFIVCLAKGSARLNFTRALFESPLLTFMGYCSYPMYLFQAVFFEYYSPQLWYQYNSQDPQRPDVYIPVSEYAWTDANKKPHVGIRPHGGMFLGKLWFSNLHYGIKICDMAVLFVLCWISQKLIQERLVGYLYSQAYQRCRGGVKAVAVSGRAIQVDAVDEDDGVGGEGGAAPRRGQQQMQTQVSVSVM